MRSSQTSTVLWFIALGSLLIAAILFPFACEGCTSVVKVIVWSSAYIGLWVSIFACAVLVSISAFGQNSNSYHRRGCPGNSAANIEPMSADDRLMRVNYLDSSGACVRLHSIRTETITYMWWIVSIVWIMSTGACVLRCTL